MATDQKEVPPSEVLFKRKYLLKDGATGSLSKNHVRLAQALSELATPFSNRRNCLAILFQSLQVNMDSQRSRPFSPRLVKAIMEVAKNQLADTSYATFVDEFESSVRYATDCRNEVRKTKRLDSRYAKTGTRGIVDSIITQIHDLTRNRAATKVRTFRAETSFTLDEFQITLVIERAEKK